MPAMVKRGNRRWHIKDMLPVSMARPRVTALPKATAQ